MQRKEERPRGKPINLFIYKERHVDIYAYPLSCAFCNSWAECRFCGRPHAPLGGLVALSLAPRFTKKERAELYEKRKGGEDKEEKYKEKEKKREQRKETERKKSDKNTKRKKGKGEER